MSATTPLKPASDDRLGRLMRFVLVGLIGAGVYFALTMGLVYSGQPVQIAHVVGYAVSIVVSYLGQKIVTFRIRGEHRRSGVRFLIATAGIATVQYLLILGLSHAGLDDRAIVVVSTIYYPIVSFIVHSLWTFRGASAPTPPDGPADPNVASR